MTQDLNYNGTYLYSRNKAGKALQWRAYSDLLIRDDGTIHIFVEHGQVDGKLQTKIRQTKSGKNIGKKNETTIYQQAIKDINSLYDAQLSSEYFFNLGDYVKAYRPVLAHKFADRKHTIDWKRAEDSMPTKWYWASPKLNGLRCFIFLDKKGKVIKYESRTGKPFKMFNHLSVDVQNAFSFVDADTILDGELFNPEIPFEVLCSLINSDGYVEVEHKGVKYNTNMVQFHCYDVINLDKLSDDYFTRFIELCLKDLGSLKIIPSVRIVSEEYLITLFKQYIKDGFEGLMLRDGSVPYEFGSRSNSLLKYKEMLDEEFRIIDIIDSENEPGQPKFIVSINDEKELTCEVRMKGNKEDNKKYLLNKSDYVNSWLTVQFQAYSSYGIPLFPVGLGIRQMEFIANEPVPSF